MAQVSTSSRATKPAAAKNSVASTRKSLSTHIPMAGLSSLGGIENLNHSARQHDGQSGRIGLSLPLW